MAGFAHPPLIETSPTALGRRVPAANTGNQFRFPLLVMQDLVADLTGDHEWLEVECATCRWRPRHRHVPQFCIDTPTPGIDLRGCPMRPVACHSFIALQIPS